MNCVANLALVAAVLVATTSAYADAPPPEAAQAFHEGQADFNAGRYDEAIAAWQRSYDLSHLSDLLYNLAQAYRLRAQPGDCASALERYQGFVANAKPSGERAQAEGYIAAGCAVVAVPTAVATPQSQLGDHERTERLTGVITAGTGVALLAVGIGFWRHAKTLGDEVTSACGNAGSGCDWSKEKPTDDAGRRDATVGRVLDVVGVAGIVGGAALYYLGMRSAEVSVAPITTAHDSGAVITWSKSW